MITDFHTHILPGVDDGSRSVEMSVEMLKKMAEQGITRVVAMPHFYAHRDTPNRFLMRRSRAEVALRQEMEKYADLPEIIVGAEVYYFPGMSNSDMLPAMTINGTNYILTLHTEISSDLTASAVSQSAVAAGPLDEYAIETPGYYYIQAWGGNGGAGDFFQFHLVHGAVYINSVLFHDQFLLL